MPGTTVAGVRKHALNKTHNRPVKISEASKKRAKRATRRILKRNELVPPRRVGVQKPKPPSRPTGGSNGGSSGGNRTRTSNSGGLRVNNKPKPKPKPKFRTVTKNEYTPMAESAAGSSSSSENMSQRRLVVTKIKERIKAKKK
jgi:hypothetical protein